MYKNSLLSKSFMTNAQIILSKTKTSQIKPIFRELLATGYSLFYVDNTASKGWKFTN